MKFPFLGPAYEARSLPFAAQRSVNLYLEYAPPESQNTDGQIMYGTPGLKLFANLTTGGGIRGQYKTAKGRYFTVSGNILYEVNSSGIETNLGTINTTIGTVSMVDNGSELLIVDGFNGYLLTLTTNTLLEINTTNFPNSGGFPSSPTHAGFLDQFFLVNQLNTQDFFISGLLDGTTWNALDFGTAESNPDIIESFLITNQNIWLLGSNGVEVFQDTGNNDFPMERIPGAIIERGILARYSAAKMNDSIFWLGRSEQGIGSIYKSVNFQSQRISTHPIERKINEMSTPEDAVGYTYELEGHPVYTLSFQADEMTFCYDEVTGVWHEKAYLQPSTGNLKKHRGINAISAFNKVLVGDHSKPLIYEFDTNTYDDNGDRIPRIRTCQHIDSDEKRVRHNSLQIVMETGVGLTS